MADRVANFQNQCRLANAIDENAAAADRVRRYPGNDVEQADVHVEHVGPGLVDDLEDGASHDLFTECASDLLLEQGPCGLIKLEFGF